MLSTYFKIMLMALLLSTGSCGKKSKNGGIPDAGNPEGDTGGDGGGGAGSLLLDVPKIKPPVVASTPPAFKTDGSGLRSPGLALLQESNCVEEAEQKGLKCLKRRFFNEGPTEFTFWLGAIDDRLGSIALMAADRSEIPCLEAEPTAYTIPVFGADEDADLERTLYLQCRFVLEPEDDDTIQFGSNIFFGMHEDKVYLMELTTSVRTIDGPGGSESIQAPQQTVLFAITDEEAEQLEVWLMFDNGYYFRRDDSGSSHVTLDGDDCQEADEDCSRAGIFLHVLTDRADPEEPIMNLSAVFTDSSPDGGACGARFVSKGEYIYGELFETYEAAGESFRPVCIESAATPVFVCASSTDFESAELEDCEGLEFLAHRLPRDYVRSVAGDDGDGKAEDALAAIRAVVGDSELAELPLFWDDAE